MFFHLRLLCTTFFSLGSAVLDLDTKQQATSWKVFFEKTGLSASCRDRWKVQCKKIDVHIVFLLLLCEDLIIQSRLHCWNSAMIEMTLRHYKVLYQKSMNCVNWENSLVAGGIFVNHTSTGLVYLGITCNLGQVGRTWCLISDDHVQSKHSDVHPIAIFLG